jgi:class 3 adenylate cyclase
MDDVRAVMDAVGSVRAALFGISEGAAMAMLFAATYPDRTRALLLFGAYGHFNSWVLPPEKLEEFIELVDRSWGTGESLRSFAPTKMSDEHFRQMWARCERLGGSPSAVIALMRMNSEIDIRHILPSIRVPTLVLHRVGDSRVNVAAGRYLARHIPGAKYVELLGVDHLITVGDTDRIADEIEEFLTGTRSGFEADRVLATVLFTDIVDSTRHAAALGDRKWRVLLDQHDNLIRQEIVRFQGREIKTLGDGFLATFDGPARAVRCARQTGETVKSLGIDLRSGIHTGEIETKGDDIGGLAVHIAARVAALAAPGEVFVSSTVKDLVAGSGLRFRDCGSRTIKGLSKKIRIFAAEADGARA